MRLGIALVLMATLVGACGGGDAGDETIARAKAAYEFIRSG